MSNQEGQFMSPDSRNINNNPREGDEYIPRPINSDPREQQQQMYGEKLQPQQRRRRGPRGCIIALIAVVVILGLAGTGIGFGIASLGAHFPSVTEAKSFTVSANPHLIINDPVGTIKVHTGGTSDQVAISATKQSPGIGGNPQNIHITYQESSDNSTITINVDESSRFLGFNSTDLNITVPTTTNLDI